MTWNRRTWMTLAAVNGLLAVAMGAFGAHVLRDDHARALMETGARYAFMHSMASFACATFMNIGAVRARYAPALFLSGSVLFAGSLYALAFGAARWTGAITPIGGLLFLAGWATLIWAASGVDRPQT